MSTFTAHGQTWVTHKPGDKMPVDGETMVYCLYRAELSSVYHDMEHHASWWTWSKIKDEPTLEIIGWRYAEAQEVRKEGPTAEEMLDWESRFRLALLDAAQAANTGGWRCKDYYDDILNAPSPMVELSEKLAAMEAEMAWLSAMFTTNHFQATFSSGDNEIKLYDTSKSLSPLGSGPTLRQAIAAAMRGEMGATRPSD